MTMVELFWLVEPEKSIMFPVGNSRLIATGMAICTSELARFHPGQLTGRVSYEQITAMIVLTLSAAQYR